MPQIEQHARQKIVTIRTSPTGHILAQGPLIREFDLERDEKVMKYAEVSIGGEQTRRGQLI